MSCDSWGKLVGRCRWRAAIFARGSGNHNKSRPLEKPRGAEREKRRQLPLRTQNARVDKLSINLGRERISHKPEAQAKENADSFACASGLLTGALS
jgi:hypothetical protein